MWLFWKFEFHAYLSTVKLVYNDHLWDPKFVAVVDRWSLFRGSFMLWKLKLGPQNCGCCRQVVIIWRWSLTQVWLYTAFTIYLDLSVKPMLLKIDCENSCETNFALIFFNADTFLNISCRSNCLLSKTKFLISDFLLTNHFFTSGLNRMIAKFCSPQIVCQILKSFSIVRLLLL